MLCMEETMFSLLPSPMASMTTTAATPITTPSSVSAVRKMFARRERNAIFTASAISA